MTHDAISGSDEPRVRIGIMRFSDGWNVIVDKGNGIEVYDPTFATEAEAQAMADKASANIRKRFDKEGVAYVRR